jgi:hypothetical protein
MSPHLSASALLPAALRGWPRRRRVVAGTAVVPLAVLFASTGPGVWSVWVTGAVTAVPAALLLAGYVAAPGTGRRLDVGCSPCAAVSGATIVGALMMRSLAPGDLGIALVAAMLVVFGLAQRLAGVTACPTPR